MNMSAPQLNSNDGAFLLIEAQARSTNIALPDGFSDIPMRVAFDPIRDDWREQAEALPMDLAMILARPWRHGQGAMAAILDSHGAIAGLFNSPLMRKARAGMGVRESSAVERIAIDAGHCWIIFRKRARGRALRKDGPERISAPPKAHASSWNKEPSWPVHELEEISNALWILCLSANHMLESNWRGDPLCKAALSERAALSRRFKNRLTIFGRHCGLSH